MRQASTFLFIFLSPLISQGSSADDTLRNEWEEMHAHSDRQIRKNWWKALDEKRISAFVASGIDVNKRDKKDRSPLHSAARYNANIQVLNRLLDAGANVSGKDSSGDTALHWASAENNNPEIILGLLKAGANINVRDKYGWTPLHAAADRSSNPKIIETLIQAGADTDLKVYYILFRPQFLLKHNSRISKDDKTYLLTLMENEP
jgi:ankyrin repeat protein